MYTYDAVGNRLTQTTLTATNVYTYDLANRLVNVDGLAHTWDNNGNLLSGAGYTYTYDSANRLVQLQQGTTLTYTIAYDGLGDRLSLSANGVPTTYTLDLNPAAGLTQILVEGSTTYLYGTGRLAQYTGTAPAYFLGDALGSVRQLTDGAGRLALTRWYDPYGNIVSNRGDATTGYGFTGEWGATLIDLRARWYAPAYGRFITRDPMMGQYTQPQTFNPYAYVLGNPTNYTDPSGMITRQEAPDADRIWSNLRANYGVEIDKDWGETTYRVVVGYGRGGVPIYGTKCGGWALGSWRSAGNPSSPGELQLVEDAVTIISNAMGSPAKFRSVFGQVQLARWNDKLNLGSVAPPGGLSAYADIVLMNSTFDSSVDWARYAVIHEFGHVWDSRKGYGLSRGLMSALHTNCVGRGCTWNPYVNPERPPGANPNCTVKEIAQGKKDCYVPYAFTYGRAGPLFEGPGWEDWAESFASYLYPAYHTGVGQTNLAPGGARELYVRFQLEHIP